MLSRRSLLASGLFAALSRHLPAQVDGQRNPLCVFSKPFNSLTFDELAAETASIGFDGVEAPIRPHGHIEPEAAPDELPRLVEALRKHGQSVTILASDINSPADPTSETVLRTAASLGIRYYRMKYFHYVDSKPVQQQIREWSARLKDLAALNRELGITALYQNHAGPKYFGAPVWDLHRALENIDPSEVGVAYDIRHATVEAGMSWATGFRLIRPHVKAVYVKDFQWQNGKVVNVPLGQGHVPERFFAMLADSDFTGPISLHEEYLDHRKPDLVPEHWAAIRKDYATLTNWLGQHG